MAKRRWKYFGDIDAMNGGYWFREDGAADYVLCVRLTACADAGGPSNMVWLESGSVYLPQDDKERQSALSYYGADAAQYASMPKEARRLAEVDSRLAYAGMDKDAGETIRIGGPDKFYNGRENIEPTKVLRANARIENYVRKNYLD